MKVDIARSRTDRVIAGYIQLTNNEAAQSVKVDYGMVFDLDSNNDIVGIEVTSPSLFNLGTLAETVDKWNQRQENMP